MILSNVQADTVQVGDAPVETGEPGSLLGSHEQAFQSRLVRIENDRLKQFDISDTDHAHKVRDRLLKAANGKLQVNRVTRKQRKRRPSPPFITSTLQQDAARKLRFSAQRTMRTAQRLYEGIELPGEGNVGLITYMRTDSVTLAEVAISEIRDVIAERYGKKNVPDEPRQFKTKSKNAQEAHEAVRPTSVARHPDDLKGVLEDDQFRLYSLIWKRTMACQMVPAVFDTVAIDFAAGAEEDGHVFRANGSVLVEPGFIAVYQEGRDDAKDDEGDKLLPDIVEAERYRELGEKRAGGMEALAIQFVLAWIAEQHPVVHQQGNMRHTAGQFTGTDQ